MNTKNIRFTPSDIVVLVYITITALYMLLGYIELEGVIGHLLTRLYFTIGIILIAYIGGTKLGKNKFLIFIQNFYPLLLLGYFYKETGYLNNIIFDYFDPWFVKTEQALWGMQPSIEFSRTFPQKWFSEVMNFGYFFYYLLTLGIALAIWFFKPNKLQKVIFIIFTSFALYYLFFALFPVKGPQFYFSGAEAKPVPSYFFSKMVTLAQNMGETETGAFPSSHVGMSIIFLIISRKYLRQVFWIILFPVVILWFATVYIKAHYLVDVIAGFVSAPIIYYAVIKLYYYTKARLL